MPRFGVHLIRVTSAGIVQHARTARQPAGAKISDDRLNTSMASATVTSFVVGQRARYVPCLPRRNAFLPSSPSSRELSCNTTRVPTTQNAHKPRSDKIAERPFVAGFLACNPTESQTLHSSPSTPTNAPATRSL